MVAHSLAPCTLPSSFWTLSRTLPTFLGPVNLLNLITIHKHRLRNRRRSSYSAYLSCRAGRVKKETEYFHIWNNSRINVCKRTRAAACPHHFLPFLPPSFVFLPLFLSLSTSQSALPPIVSCLVRRETNWSGDTFGRLPLLLSSELIAVPQSVWFDFIGEICFFSRATLGVWLERRHQPNYDFFLFLSSSRRRRRAGNWDLAGFIP